MNILTQIADIIGKENVHTRESMAKHTTFKAGGNADYLVSVSEVEQISELIKIAKEQGLPYYILGKGSNVLFSDQGYRGMIIQISNNFSHTKWEKNTVVAKAGISIAKLALEAARYSLSGLEFASGILGTLGGAIYMNAGAYGGEMKDCVSEVKVLTSSGELATRSLEEAELGYRTSSFQQKNEIIIEAKLTLIQSNQEQIFEEMKELNHKRKTKQPLEFGSAGSTFKRPEGYFAGKLIEDAGLRGYRIGDAQVSEKHCGFIINRGEATATQIYQLIQYVKDIVYQNTGITLETEVRLIGDFE